MNILPHSNNKNNIQTIDTTSKNIVIRLLILSYLMKNLKEKLIQEKKN